MGSSREYWLYAKNARDGQPKLRSRKIKICFSIWRKLDKHRPG